MNEYFPYRDIIPLPHHQAEGRRHMSLYDRAAQFSAFAALSGYDDMIFLLYHVGGGYSRGESLTGTNYRRYSVRGEQKR